jgi:hypothetical protein
MISQDFIDALRRGLDEAFTPLAESVIGGQCQSQDQYREAVGTMAGLKAAREIVDNLVKKANSGEIV